MKCGTKCHRTLVDVMILFCLMEGAFPSPAFGGDYRPRMRCLYAKPRCQSINLGDSFHFWHGVCDELLLRLPMIDIIARSPAYRRRYFARRLHRCSQSVALTSTGVAAL